jgi:hypothetical protein
MGIDEVIGYYTYRSFLNRPLGAPNEILWGEGELLLFISDEGAVSGTLAFPVDAGAAEKSFMDLSGTVTAWDQLAFRLTGRGRPGSAIADYEYEYDCRLAHEWDAATPAQRPSLVGTVVRKKDHGSAKAGATASFIAVQRDFVEPRNVPGVALIPEAVAMLGSRAHRLRHTVWHTVRGDWNSRKMTQADRGKLKQLGWHLADPPLTADRVLDLTNGAGEDFLYMHRRMIGMLHEVYDAAGKPRPRSWTQLPPANVPQFAYKEAPSSADPALRTFVYDPDNSGVMVPPPTSAFLDSLRDPATGNVSPFFRFNKTGRGLANLMQNLASNLRNPRVLSQLTLGAYGNLIEFTVHNWMHMRWATAQRRDPNTGKPVVRTPYDIDAAWDVPENDYLGDFHSSHVNPVFWKLHGWVDECIGAWQTAHDAAHPGQVKPREVRGIAWYAAGPWVLKADPFDWPGAGGGHHHHGAHGHGDDDEVRTLEQVMAILKEVAERPDPAAAVAGRAGDGALLPGFARFSVLESAN